MKAKAILLGLLFVLPTLIFSQTITIYDAEEHNYQSAILGQSFTAT